MKAHLHIRNDNILEFTAASNRDLVYIRLPGFLSRPFLIALLPLSRVPAQLTTNTINPILRPTALGHDIRKRISTGTDGNIVTWTQLDSFTAIEARPAARPSIVRDADPEHDRVRQNDGPEGERVCADGRNQYHRVFWMAERTAGCEVVGG